MNLALADVTPDQFNNPIGRFSFATLRQTQYNFTEAK